ncbi:MAG: hypothetical protein GXP45_07785 [bacterium]|nr:hypothetical protein [bacterium]
MIEQIKKDKLEDFLGKDSSLDCNHMDALQVDVLHETLGQEVKKEVLENQDSHQEWRNLIQEVLPDLDSVVLDACVDELKNMHLYYGFLRDKHQIALFLERAYKQYLHQRKWKAEKKEFKNKTLSRLFHEQLSRDILDSLYSSPENLDDLDQDKQKIMFMSILLLAQEYENMDKEKKKKLKEWLEKYIALLLEGKILEVFEIQIAEDGTITIR